MARSSYRPLMPRSPNESARSNNSRTSASGPGGSPLVGRVRPLGKPRCPPALSRLRVEKVEGGLVVAGVIVAANCQLLLPVFGFLFMLVGCVLTVTSYRGCGENEQPERYAARIAFTGNSRVLGPVCIVAGAIMTLAGCILCLLMRQAQRSQRRVAFHCPIHGDFYPASPGSEHATGGGGGGGVWKRARGWLGMETSAPAEGAPAAPRCPRSADPATPTQPDACPPPLPFLVPSDSVAAMGSVLGAPLSPDQAFGSIKSLAISRDVASFPLSRSPSPPPLRKNELSNNCEDRINGKPPRPNFDCGTPACEFRVVECKITTTDEIRKAPSINRDLKPTESSQTNLSGPADESCR